MLALAVVGGRFLPVTDYHISVQQDSTTVPTLTKRSLTTQARTTVEAEITTPRDPLLPRHTTQFRLYNEKTEFRFDDATVLTARGPKGSYTLDVEATKIEELQR